MNRHRPRLTANRAVPDEHLVPRRIHVDVRFQVKRIPLSAIGTLVEIVHRLSESLASPHKNAPAGPLQLRPCPIRGSCRGFHLKVPSAHATRIPRRTYARSAPARRPTGGDSGRSPGIRHGHPPGYQGGGRPGLTRFVDVRPRPGLGKPLEEAGAKVADAYSAGSKESNSWRLISGTPLELDHTLTLPRRGNASTRPAFCSTIALYLAVCDRFVEEG